MRTYGKIKVSRAEGVETVTLFNPERRNAIGPQMSNELLHAFDEACKDPEVKVIVLTGEGKAFCAGGDFAAMTSGEASQLEHKGDYADLLLAMVKSEKPIVARVNGHAMGGGFGLVAASTLAIATSEAQLGTPEINVGLFPMMIMAVLARVVPRKRLMQMMLLGEKISADEAKALGVLNEVVAPGELDVAVNKLASGIASKSPSTVRLGMRAFAAQDDLELEKSLPMLRERLAECLSTNDAREGLMAFLEKRAPVWSGS